MTYPAMCCCGLVSVVMMGLRFSFLRFFAISPLFESAMLLGEAVTDGFWPSVD